MNIYKAKPFSDSQKQKWWNFDLIIISQAINLKGQIMSHPFSFILR